MINELCWYLEHKLKRLLHFVHQTDIVRFCLLFKQYGVKLLITSFWDTQYMIFGVCTPPCQRKFCILWAKKAKFQALSLSNFIVINFWLHAPCQQCLRKQMLHLVSYKMLTFRPFLNLNLFLGGCMPAPSACLAYEKCAFCDLKMFNFLPYFSLNV